LRRRKHRWHHWHWWSKNHSNFFLFFFFLKNTLSDWLDLLIFSRWWKKSPDFTS
jgi:hypothetical protein